MNLIQSSYTGATNQQFTLQDASEGYFYLEPVHASDMALAQNGTTTEGYSRISMQEKTPSEDMQKFQFVKVGQEYAIVDKSGRGIEVKSASYTNGAGIVATEGVPSTVAFNKRWILEEVSERLESNVTYTPNGRYVSTITDARGKTTTNQYDMAGLLLTGVTDANGTTTTYTYYSQNDRLTSVEKISEGTKQVYLCE